MYFRTALIFALLFCFGDCRNLTNIESQLRAVILQRHDIDITARPVINESEVLAVLIGVDFRQFIKLDESLQTFQVQLNVYFTYMNPFLAWSHLPEFKHIKRVSASETEVYLPSVVVTNGFNDRFVLMGSNRGRNINNVIIHRDGQVLWQPAVSTLTTECFMDLRSIPFDSHTCVVRLKSFSDCDSQFFEENQSSMTLSKGFMPETAIWRMTSATSAHEGCLTTYNDKDQASPKYSYVSYKFSFKRKPEYYVYCCLIPSCALTVIQLSTFALPRKGTDRTGFAVALMVVLTMHANFIQEHLPVTSQVVALNFWLTLQTLAGAVITLYSACMCYAHKHGKRRRHRALERIDLLVFLVALSLSGIYCFATISMSYKNMIEQANVTNLGVATLQENYGAK